MDGQVPMLVHTYEFFIFDRRISIYAIQLVAAVGSRQARYQ
jgi:hypothetical protein